MKWSENFCEPEKCEISDGFLKKYQNRRGIGASGRI